ncbi:MAG: beta-ketoacyl synthase chain length factor [Rhodospirillum sp.]|nr:beta-ketoacyl synthase chain length factor [Rhodospirillum sp.]MCF8490835.1 beta-ketoacyl synthase chain length factor [Rhodospirillum sp.]MCF8501394.1 beta-ketoacyl synthase chain length factor [Rhodospirillum sp.]
MFLRRIVSWAVWTGKGAPTPDTRETQNLAKSLKPGWRRRLDLHGRAAAEVFDRVLPQGGQPRIIFTSRHGNMDRTLRLMGQMLRGEPPSPTDFSLSVHNTLPGIASINWGITQSHTALAAGSDTFLAGLTETLCQGLDDPTTPSLLIHVDLPLPAVYGAFEDAPLVEHAIALWMESAATDGGEVMTFTPTKTRWTDASPWDQVAALNAFLANGDQSEVELVGRTSAWRITRHV